MNQATAHAPKPSTGRPLIAFNGWFLGQRRTGSGQYLQQLVRALRESSGWRITIFVPAGRQSSDAGSEVDADSVSVVTLRTPFDRLNKNLAKIWFEQVAVPRACRRHGAHLLHVPYWATPALSPVPVVTTVHDIIPLVLPAYSAAWGVRLYTRFVTWTMHRSTLVLADSSASGEDILHKVRLPAHRLRVVHLGIDPRYQPVINQAELDAARKRYQLPDRFLLYLGGFDPRKNVPRLIRAYRQARVQSESIPALVIAGKLPEPGSDFFSDPVEVARDAGMTEQVHFAGEITEEDKPALYSLATCLVWPSLYEGFGLPVLEAMACGTPVITSDASSLSELAGDGGILVDPESENDIAEAIATLVGDTSTHAEYVSRGLKRAQQFRWSKTAQLTAQAYGDILPSQRAWN